MTTINLLSTQNLSVAQTATLKEKIANGIVTTSDLTKALNPPTLTLKAVCNDVGGTESDRLAVFTGTKSTYVAGETVEITVTGAVIPGTTTDYNTTKTYPFLRWLDGETSPTRTVTLGETGNTELVAVFDVSPVATVADLKAAVANTEGKYYLQVSDIDLSEESVWVSELSWDGTEAANIMTFNGVYDGGGHTVSNLRLAKAEYSGLFARVNGPSTIANLTVKCLGVVDNSTESTSWGGAALAGYINKNKSSDGVLISNVVTEGTVGDASHHTCHNTGGMIGRFDGNGGATPEMVVYNCVNNASVYCSRPNSSQHSGGIIGYIMSSVAFVNCANHGAIITTKTLGNVYTEGVGGMVGNDANGNGTMFVIDCVSDGIMSIPDGSVNFGSIVGYKQYLNISGKTVVDGMTKLSPSGEGGYINGGMFGIQTGIREYTLVKTPFINTPIVYKALSDGTSDVVLGAAGDYILIDTSLFVPTVKFGGNVVTGEDVDGMPNVKKYTAA